MRSRDREIMGVGRSQGGRGPDAVAAARRDPRCGVAAGDRGRGHRDAQGRGAALAAGAGGVRVGTRFIAAAESDAHPAWVQAVIDAGPTDAVVSSAFNAGMPQPGPHRVLRSSIVAAERLTTEEAGVVRLAGAEIVAELARGA